MAEVHGAIGEAAGACELDVVGAQHLQHLRAHEAQHQGHLEQRQGEGRQHDRLEARSGEQSRVPPAELHRLAASEGREAPVRRQPDGRRPGLALYREDIDQQDADHERRHGHAREREGHDGAAVDAVAAQGRQHTERDAHGQRQQGRHRHQFQSRRHAFDDQVGHRTGQAIALAEIAGRGIAEEARELHHHGVFEAELATDLLALRRPRFLADHVVHGVAHEVEERKAHERDRQHDRQRLQETGRDESQHRLLSAPAKPHTEEVAQRPSRSMATPRLVPPHGGDYPTRFETRPYGPPLKVRLNAFH